MKTKIKILSLLAAVSIIALLYFNRPKRTDTATIKTDEQTLRSQHENKRFVVKYSIESIPVMSQFDTKDEAVMFANSATLQVYTLHYIYDRQTGEHIAGGERYDRQDDVFCKQIQAVKNNP